MKGKQGKKEGLYLWLEAAWEDGNIVGVGCRDRGVVVRRGGVCVGDKSKELMEIIRCRRWLMEQWWVWAAEWGKRWDNSSPHMVVPFFHGN